MRSLLALGLLAVLLLAGCSSAPAPIEDRQAPAGTPETVEETDEVPFGDAVAGSTLVDAGREEFEVPDGVLRLAGEAEWDCLSLCRLDLRLVAPDGSVAYEDSRGSGATMEVEDPEAGTWAFEWGAGEGASLEVDGTLHLTYERLS